MSEEQPSEEKSLPATDKKLKDARLKGQVSTSQDFVTGLVVVTAVSYLWIRWTAMIQHWEAILDLPAQLGEAPLIPASVAMLKALARLGAELVMPVVALVFCAAVVANLIVKRGIPLAADPVLPKFNRIDPIKGFTRIFSLKSLLDFVKSLAKAALLLTALGLTILFGLNALLQAPSCGIGCVMAGVGAAMRPLLTAAALLFVLAGLLDIGLQRWLFLREMRMTKTEAKRERKEMEGEPVFRRARRQRHREAAMASTRLGTAHATMVILSPGRVAVALRFIRDQTPAPVLVARAYNENAATLAAEATAANVAIIKNPDLAERLAKRTAIGSFIPKNLFTEVATILVQNSLA